MLRDVIYCMHFTGANGCPGRLVVRAPVDHATAESALVAFDEESTT